eukprot:17689-Eustigmatos_ZCMA.PRE.1
MDRSADTQAGRDTYRDMATQPPRCRPVDTPTDAPLVGLCLEDGPDAQHVSVDEFAPHDATPRVALGTCEL